MKFILGKKIDMTQVFREDGTVVPVTRVQAGPCVVTQIKTADKDGVESVQVGFGKQKNFRLNKAEQGHLKDIHTDEDKTMTVRFLRDFKTNSENVLKRGDVFTVGIFSPGEKVSVVGFAKGRGFQGVVKRHGFRGGPASHGHKDNLRMPGSIGAGGVQRTFKGIRMGGHMGDNRVTVHNLEIVEVHPETNEIYIKGAVPGARNGVLSIHTAEGKIMVESQQTAGENTVA
ncbi:MAG TPA: 50S ribosomal protein L3 [Candidatus Magasanikbacteria bacterium]|nr:50S ribosomal protein L3 [Candidatus Magasanikbacteria bacterium]